MKLLELKTPYTQFTEELISHIIANDLIPANKQEAFNYVVQKALKPCQNSIAVIWNAEDIRMYALTQGYVLSEEVALRILHNLEKNYDPAIGINWQVVFEAIKQKISDLNYLVPQIIDNHKLSDNDRGLVRLVLIQERLRSLIANQYYVAYLDSEGHLVDMGNIYSEEQAQQAFDEFEQGKQNVHNCVQFV